MRTLAVALLFATACIEEKPTEPPPPPAPPPAPAIMSDAFMQAIDGGYVMGFSLKTEDLEYTTAAGNLEAIFLTLLYSEAGADPDTATVFHRNYPVERSDFKDETRYSGTFYKPRLAWVKVVKRDDVEVYRPATTYAGLRFTNEADGESFTAIIPATGY